ncbi:hypothetical protein V8C86DRAFT_521616 [Haematococcus lacustris]
MSCLTIITLCLVVHHTKKAEASEAIHVSSSPALQHHYRRHVSLMLSTCIDARRWQHHTTRQHLNNTPPPQHIDSCLTHHLCYVHNKQGPAAPPCFS